MKGIIILCLVGVAVVVARPDDKYTNRYDNINLKEILDNQRLLGAYIKCMTDKGRCTPEGNELKSHIKEALETNCAKCTDAQREGTRIVLGHLINKEPEYWNQLKTKYDNTGKYASKYEQDLKTL